MSGAVTFSLAGGIAQVVLSHPGKFNAMSRAMWRQLRETFESLHVDLQVRCVLLRGEGGHFCSGGDISEYGSFRFSEDSLRDFHEREVWGGLKAILDCDAPVVAQIEGNCLGAGLEIASCCDLRIASEQARFGAPIAKLGFPMAPREAAVVIRAVGELTAREMLLSAAVLDAAEMKQRGFLNQVATVDDLTDSAAACANRIAQLAPNAARLNKQAFRALAQSFSTDSATESIANSYRYAASGEHREGVTAFIEKRKPIFAA